MKQKSNIEDFLRNKFEQLDAGSTGDWGAFERKLRRAIWARRARSFASLALFTFALFAGYNGIQNLEHGGSLNEEGNYVLEVVDFSEVQDEDLGEVYIVQPASNKVEVSDEQVKEKAAMVPEVQIVAKKETPNRSLYDAERTNLASAAVGASSELPLVTDQALPELVSLPDEPERLAQSLTELPSKKLESIPFFNEQDLSSAKAESGAFQGRGAALLATLDISRKGIYLGSPISLKPPVPLTNRSKQGHYISPLQERNPWSYAINVYPNFTFRQFKVDRKKLNLLHRDFIDAIEASERGGFSLNIGLGVSRRVGDITYLNGGVEYITYNTEASFNFSNFREANMDEATGVIRSYSLKDSPERIVFADRNSYHYLNFPLSISYQPWASSHIRLNLEAGGSFMYFVTAKGRTIDYQTLEEVDLADRTYKKYLGSFSVKVGANYYVSESINFGFEPTLMYFTNTIYTEEIPFYVIPYSVGLNLHMQVKLN